MPYKNPHSPEAIASRKRRDRRHYLKYKEKHLAKSKEKREAGYYKKLRDKYPERFKKSSVVGMWKHRGIKDDDLSSVYDYYIKETHCWICGNEFKQDEYRKRMDRCLDHNHETGEIRYICCRSCNSSLLRKQN